MEHFVAVSLMVVLGLSFSGASDCPDLWVSYQGSCYLFGHQNYTFVEAEHYCQHHHNGHLVHLETRDENAFIKDHILYAVYKRWWIGLTDDGVEGVWLWNVSGDKPEFTDWAPNEPNGGQRESCAEMVQYDSTTLHWNDVSCNSPRAMICERQAGDDVSIVG